MKKLLSFTILILFVLSSNILLAQCQDFTEQKVLPQLQDFLPTGRYHSFTMKEGDEILIFKSLMPQIQYKFVIGADKSLPDKIIFIIKDWDNNVIYDNRFQKFSKTFIYHPKKPMRVKIYIKVPKINNPPHSGCVALVIGMKKVQ
jgi:hypothetical protein